MMYYTVYVSSATELLTTEQLKAIVETSIKNNAILNITGMLLYNEGNFIQLIEGKKEDIKHIYQVIERDQRHTGILKLSEGELELRNFPDWSMGFKVISSLEYLKFEEYAHPKERLSQADSHAAITLLKSFSELY